MNKTDRTRLRELAERYPKPFYVQKFVEKLELHDHNGSEIRSTHAAELIALACNSVLPLLDRVEELEKALEGLTFWLREDTLEIMKDTQTMGITFDQTDCASLRKEVEKAESALRGEEKR